MQDVAWQPWGSLQIVERPTLHNSCCGEGQRLGLHIIRGILAGVPSDYLTVALAVFLLNPFLPITRRPQPGFQQ